jgi:hypothetical protein
LAEMWRASCYMVFMAFPDTMRRRQRAIVLARIACFRRFLPLFVTVGLMCIPGYAYANSGRLANISTRANVGVNDDVLICGFIVGGPEPKRMILRAIGPSLLAAGVIGAMANPTLELHDSTGATIASNDDWQSSEQASEISASGLAPQDPLESAIIAILEPGNYTAIVRGANNTTGIALVEAYEHQSTATRLVNVSTRGQVGVENEVLIGGFIVGGSDSKTVIVRALGPSLGTGPNPLLGALANPVLELHDGSGNLLSSNDDWINSPQHSAIDASGLAPSNSLESAILSTLGPGNYTAIVRGLNNLTGIGLVEVYDLDPPATSPTPPPTPTPTPTPAAGVWIAPRTDGQSGSGTNSDPYDGSTAARLTALMNNVIPANTVVHFVAGNYLVSTLNPKAGVMLLGAGKDITNFLWDGTPQVAMIYSYGGAHGALVSDLTLNGQQDVWGATPMAITIFDSNNVTLRNVRATNFKGGAGEAFPIAQFDQSISVTGAVIESCEVDHFVSGSGGATLLGLGHGGAVTPTSVTGIVRNNYVHDCPGVQAFGSGGGTNCVFEGNLSVGADKGWYHDTNPLIGSQIKNNQFINCTHYGIVTTSAASGTDEPNNSSDRLIIANNIVTMDPSITEAVAGISATGNHVTNTQVSGNSVTKSNANQYQYGFSLTGPGTIAHDNYASPGFTNIMP